MLNRFRTFKFSKDIKNASLHCIGSKMKTLVNEWILPIGGVASGRVCSEPAKQACL